MALNLQQFFAEVDADLVALADGRAPAGVFKCDACGVPLQETLTGHRPCNDGTHLCSDCYFEKLGKELDDHPIHTLRVIRGA